MIFFGYLASKRAMICNGTKVPFFKWEVILPIIGFSLVFGMRYGVGDDHLTYLNTYLTGEGIERYEWGFRYITMLFSTLNLHFAVYFTFLAFLQIFFFFLAFKEERFLFPFLIFFLFSGGYYLSWMNGIRQDIAACVFIFAVKFIDQKKFVSYLLCCSLAFLFHKSAIILIIFYPLLKSGFDYFKSIIVQLLIFLCALIIYYTNINIVDFLGNFITTISYWLNYEVYTSEGIEYVTTEATTGIGFFLTALVDLIIIIYSKNLKGFYNSRKFNNVYTLYFIGAIAGILFAGSGVLLRPFRYLAYFRLILLAYFMHYTWKNSKQPIIAVVFFLIAVIFILLFSAILYRGDTNTARFFFFWQA
jgi:hypothetical protein